MTIKIGILYIFRQSVIQIGVFVVNSRQTYIFLPHFDLLKDVLINVQ